MTKGDTMYTSYWPKSRRWAFITWLIKILGCDAEMNRAISEYTKVAETRGGWRSLDKALNLINTYPSKTVQKSQVYKDLMLLRPWDVVSDEE